MTLMDRAPGASVWLELEDASGERVVRLRTN
jgi:hypothetical protein